MAYLWVLTPFRNFLAMWIIHMRVEFLLSVSNWEGIEFWELVVKCIAYFCAAEELRQFTWLPREGRARERESETVACVKLIAQIDCLYFVCFFFLYLQKHSSGQQTKWEGPRTVYNSIHTHTYTHTTSTRSNSNWSINSIHQMPLIKLGPKKKNSNNNAKNK